MPEINMAEQLGYLRRAAEDQARLMESMQALIKEQGRESAAARSDVASRLSEVERKVEMFEPVAKDFSRWRERGIGALMVLTMISAMVGAFSAKIMAWVSKVLGGS